MVKFLAVAPRLPVSDLTRTIAFYRDVLGFQAGKAWPEDKPEFVVMEYSDTQLQFSIGEPAKDVAISLNVDDALAIYAAVKDRVKINWGPEVYWYGRREFAFNDPDGYGIIVSARTNDPVEAEGE